MGEIILTDSDMAELNAAFFAQAQEILENLQLQILAIEKKPDEENWKALKRSFHTLKGDSKAMGFDALSTVAHKAEDLIVDLKDKKPDRASIDLLLECSDAFRGFLDKVASGEEPDISDIVSRIESHIAGAGAVTGEHETQRVNKTTAGNMPFLKIEPERVDRIMNLVGELVIGRSMMSKIVSDIDRLDKEQISSRLDNLNLAFERTVSDLQRSVMKMRMLPVDVVFRKLPRLVRDLSAERGKLVRLEIRGEKTELDKGIVDVIGEPLLHIIRNAIDHGIETPAERQAAGKPEEGLLAVRAFHQGSQMVIEIEDDGRGIDAEKIIEKAVEKGIISREDSRNINPRDALNLIFTSGFSTAETVTEVSGRGVGMDIVKDVVESLRGIIEVVSEKGAGTKFTLRLPLTLAIIKSILFLHNGDTYALPLSSVIEILRVLPDNLETIAGNPVLRHRHGIIPLITVNGDGASEGKMFILLIGVAQHKAGLVTDKIIGEEELVIKAIDEMASTGLAAGASILGDGKVVLILDPLYLIKRNQRTAGI